jgi:uncharacterized protein (TIRG00374 family)
MKHHVVKALEVLLFVSFLGGLLFFVPLEQIIQAVRDVSAVPFWISCLLYLPISYLAAMRLYILVNKQGIEITRLKLFEIGFVVKFYSFFSPASTVGSFLRWYKLSGGGKSAEALTAVTINRLIDVFIAVIFGLFWAVGSVDENYLTRPTTFMIFLGVVIALWLFGTRYAPGILKWLKNKIETSPRSWLRKVALFLERLADSLEVYSRFSVLELILLVSLGLIGELFSLLAMVYLAQSLNIPVSFSELGWMKSIFFLAALTPFTLVGGLGLREVSVVLVLSAFGISAGLAAAFSFLMYARSAVLSLFGGALELSSLVKVPSHEKP